jgi:hypothetical protein
VVSGSTGYHHPIVTTRPLSAEGPFGRFADRLLTAELPDLPPDRRGDTVAFVCRRADQIPSPLRLGVTLLVVVIGLVQRMIGLERTTSFLRATSFPLVGELARMVRSLGFTYIWETWPASSPTGGVTTCVA